MFLKKLTISQIVFLFTGILVLLMGVVLFFIPPALFPDPGMGFQVLRSMKLGSGFNKFISPDQSDISQNYDEFITWWSPGQYLVPGLLKSLLHLNLGRAIAVTVTICQISGMAGLYCFFKKIGFTTALSTAAIVFIVVQEAFMVPFVFYNGGEILLFAFEGWFLYGCVAIHKTDVKLVVFVLLSGWIGFFLKSSFIWIYIAGLLCLWIRASVHKNDIWPWIKNAPYIALPALVSLITIYLSFLSKGQSPASATNGLKLTTETFGFPLASPLLSAFSIDDLLHGLIFHTGTPVINSHFSFIVVVSLALLSIAVIIIILKYVPGNNYRLFLLVFYLVALLFFGIAYLRQLTISYEARHFRLLGFLVVPGMLLLISNSKPGYKLLFSMVFISIAFISIRYTIKGFLLNQYNAARGVTGIAQPNIDQLALNTVIKLDRASRNATFVFTSNDIGLEVLHNRIITLQPITDNLSINIDDYKYNGHAGPLYIILPESYAGPKEKLIMKSFPGYKGFNLTMLSDNYVLYAAK